MKRREYFLTAALAFAVAMMANPPSVGAVMFPIVVNNCGNSSGSATKTLIFPIAVKQDGGTCTGGEGGSVPRTGQETCYDGSGGTGTVACTGTGQDGELQKGAAWPVPRFTSNNNGTVTDNLTGLIWTEDVDCDSPSTWGAALTYANNAKSGGCGIEDSSSAGTWRLPNVSELLSLVDREYSGPALSNAAGDGQHGVTGEPAFSSSAESFDDCHWTSTTYRQSPGNAWTVNMLTGASSGFSKTAPCRVWLVRDPN